MPVDSDLPGYIFSSLLHRAPQLSRTMPLMKPKSKPVAAREALQRMKHGSGATQPTAKMTAAREAFKRREPETVSGSTNKLSSAPPIVEREKLGAKVEKLAVEAFSMYEHSLKKLSELRPMIAQLRKQFMKLKPGDKIADCRTWTQYCDRVLHRTDRRIRQILEGNNPASEKHRPKHLQAKNDIDTLPEPQTVKVPEARDAEWTPELVVETAFKFVYSVFQKAKLAHDDHNKAAQQLLDKLRNEIVLGHREKGE